MDNKRIAFFMFLFSLIFLGFLIYFNNALQVEYFQMGCVANEKCVEVKDTIGITHVGFGFFGFMLGLSCYLIFFGGSDEKIFRRLEEEKSLRILEEKFNIILMALDEYERKVLKTIKENDGITQNSLLIKLDMSKAKLSYVLSELERRKLIKKVKRGKTNEIWLRV